MTDTIGNQLSQPDPLGWLVFDHLPYAIQLAEDSTQAADRERGIAFERPATATERALLAHLGHAESAELPDDLTTHVRWTTVGVRNRRWPQLENTQEVTP